jgi:hypothetical protein
MPVYREENDNDTVTIRNRNQILTVINVQANTLHNKPGFAIMLLLLESEQRFRQRA